MKEEKFIYDALITEVYDGDTCTAIVDLGLNVSVKAKLRLSGIDSPELRGVTEEVKKRAEDSREYLKQRLLNKMVRIHSLKKGKYGRLVVKIWVYDDDGKLPEESINEEMIRKGLAEIYK